MGLVCLTYDSNQEETFVDHLYNINLLVFNRVISGAVNNREPIWSQEYCQGQLFSFNQTESVFIFLLYTHNLESGIFASLIKSFITPLSKKGTILLVLV